MGNIVTVSGIHLNPLTARAEDIRLGDIAHALSLICRGGGHETHFYSVAQHCISCCREAEARGYSKRIRLACLLHDASEAYMADLVTPLKDQFPGYREAEDRLLDLIWTCFLGSAPTAEERKIVFEIDKDFLSYEFKYLMPEECGTRYQKILTKPSMEYESPKQVEETYLALAEDLL